MRISFEQAVFARRKAGRFTSDGVCQMWLDANRPYYGDAVELTDGYRWGWSYIPHFIHSRFYCYSYVFGELLVLSLYRQYKEQGASFIPKYIALLEAGGSDSPEALLARAEAFLASAIPRRIRSQLARRSDVLAIWIEATRRRSGSSPPESAHPWPTSSNAAQRARTHKGFFMVDSAFRRDDGLSEGRWVFEERWYSRRAMASPATTVQGVRDTPRAKV